MRRLSKMSSPASSRRHCLLCEPLEQRALLAALVDSLEIAPGPAAVFTAQAKSFIETTLEQTRASQHQTPIRTSTATAVEYASDGTTVKITNFTVELARETVAAVRPDVPTSNLVFTFLVYPDSSVSIRARYIDSESAASSSPLAEDQFATFEDPAKAICNFFANVKSGRPFSSESAQEPFKSPVSQAANPPERSKPAPLDSTQPKGSFQLELSANESPQAIDRPRELENDSRPRSAAATERSTSHRVADEMICLDYATEDTRAAEGTSTELSSAMVQIFLHSSVVQEAAGTAISRFESTARNADEAFEELAGQFEHVSPTSLTVVTLVGSGWLTNHRGSKTKPSWNSIDSQEEVR